MDFKKYAPEGGCTQICTFEFPCGHPCERTCHLLKQDHTEMKCLDKNPCTRLCDAKLHPCKRRCNQDCGYCMEKVDKQLPCGHQQALPCWMTPEAKYCSVMVDKIFEPCEHQATVKCSETKCPCPCENRLSCGHQCINTCHPEVDPDHLKYTCKKPCTKFNKNCKSEHACEKMCYEECDNCIIKVKRKVKCGHQFEMKCMDDPDTIHCKKKCKKTLSCGHWCKRTCYEECEPCQEVVTKKIEGCQHELKFACGAEPKREHCKQKCDRQLQCGHPCTRNCAEPCTKKCTVQVEMVVALCGHNVQLFCWEKSLGESLNNISLRKYMLKIFYPIQA
jgi:hypothetical protein